MDPVTIAALAMTAYGAYEKYTGAQAQTQTQQQMTDVEIQQNAVRQQATHLQAQRMQMENLRNAQRARSLALAGAVTGGAQFGSGLSGGFGQIAGASNTNALSISENLGISDQMFGLDSKLSQLKKDYAAEGGQINLGSGLMDVGAVIGKNQVAINSLSKNAAQKITNPLGLDMSSFGIM